MKLNIQFTLDTFGTGGALPPAEAIAEALQDAISDWRDGRYRYPTEQLHDALHSLTVTAVENAIFTQKIEEHGTDMVRIDEHSLASKAYLETEKALKALKQWGIESDSFKVSAVKESEGK